MELTKPDPIPRATLLPKPTPGAVGSPTLLRIVLFPLLETLEVSINKVYQSELEQCREGEEKTNDGVNV